MSEPTKITIEKRLTHYIDSLIEKHQAGDVPVLDLAFYGNQLLEAMKKATEDLKEYLGNHSQEIEAESKSTGVYKNYSFTQGNSTSWIWGDCDEVQEVLKIKKEYEDRYKMLWAKAQKKPELIQKEIREDKKGNEYEVFYIMDERADEETGEVKEVKAYLPVKKTSTHFKATFKK